MNDPMATAGRLRGFLAADPGNVPLACELVDALFAAGDFAAAEATLAGMPPAALAAPGIRFRQARCGLILGRYDDAATLLQGLIAEGVANMALWHDLAFAQLCTHRLADAAATLAEAETRFGPDAELAIVGARVALFEQDFPRAHAILDRALAMAPNHATALGLRALAHLDSGEADAALATAKACLAMHPDQHESLLVAGTALLWRQELDEAESHLNRALERYPNSGRVLSSLGQVFMLRNDLPGAVDVLERAVVAMPDHIGTWHALAWAQLLQGQMDAAEASYRSAFDLDDNFGDSHGGLALIDALKGRTEQAERSVKIALRLNPQCVTALYAKTVLMADRGDEGGANRLLGSLISQIRFPVQMDVRDFARNLRARVDPRSVR